MGNKSIAFSASGVEPIKESFFKINEATLPLKITLFFYYGAMSALLPYLTIHMQDIGISIQETAIIYGVLPFTSFAGPPLMGLLADHLGQYKTVLVLATIANGVFHTLLLVVPIYKEEAGISNAVLEWNPSLNTVSLFPQNNQFCQAFMSNFSDSENFSTEIFECKSSKFDSITSQHYAQTSVGGFNSSESNGFCRLEKTDNGLLKFICTDSDLEKQWYNGKEPPDHRANISFLLQRTYNCSLGVENPFKATSDLNQNLISCQTNMTFYTGETIIFGDNTLTFWLYFFLRIVGSVFMSSCFSLLDATTLAVVKRCPQTEYGKERIWAILGLATVSPIAGFMVDVVSSKKGYTDYSSAFYVSDALLILNILAYFIMNLEVEKPEEGIAKNGGKLLKLPEVSVFIAMIFVLGSMWGFVESYLFIFLLELNAPNYLLGLTLTVGSLTGVPFLYGAERIVNKFGRVNLIVLAFLTYFVRFFGYSYIWNPFWCFPFEAMEAFTYHLMWVAGATYCGLLAPKGLLATLMGIVGSFHYSLGKGNGSFIGGYMLGTFGTRLSFRYFGVTSGIFGIIYFMMNQFWLKGVVKRRLSKEVRNRADDVVEEEAKSKQTKDEKADELTESEVTEAMLFSKLTIDENSI